jgi:sigma-E factor negative regulatory protein RseA
MEKMETQELISALADGQLRGEDFARGVEAAARDPVAREAWHNYHLIGDVLRSGEFAAGTVPGAFLSRLQSRLEQEQRLTAPQVSQQQQAVSRETRVQPAANDASFRWKLVAGFASLAAVAAIAWTAIGGLPGKPEQAQLAAVPAPGAPAGSGQVMLRDPRLDEFLAAHRQLAGASALQMPAGFLRNAAFEAGNR